MQSSSSSGSRGQWEEYVEQARAKLPEPPPNLMDAYVKWIPWIAIVFGVIGLIFSVGFGLFAAVLSPFLVLAGGEGIKTGLSSIFAIVLGGVASVLSLAGGWMMKQMRATGWWIYAVGLIVSVLNDLATFSILGLAITLLIAWLHVHVRPRYS